MFFLVFLLGVPFLIILNSISILITKSRHKKKDKELYKSSREKIYAREQRSGRNEKEVLHLPRMRK